MSILHVLSLSLSLSLFLSPPPSLFHLNCSLSLPLSVRSPLKDRLEFTDSLLNEIADSADKPLEVSIKFKTYLLIKYSQGNGWWRTSDEPWQTLACCIELTEALRSGDPENFVSHTPVHQVPNTRQTSFILLL